MPPSISRLALLASLLVGGCSSTAPSETQLERLEAAGRLWDAQGAESYHYEFRFLCAECPEDFGHLRRIRVDVGDITQVVDLVASEVVEIDPRSATIQRLFRDLHETLSANPWRFEVTYHPTLGYPTSLYVDLRELVQDDEFAYEAGNLVVLQ